jgi:hypothetical protein
MHTVFDTAGAAHGAADVVKAAGSARDGRPMAGGTGPTRAEWGSMCGAKNE